MSISSQPTKSGRWKNIPSAGAWHDAGRCTYTEFARRLRTPLLAPIKQPPSELVIVRKQVRLSLGLLIRPAHLHGQERICRGAHCGSGHRRESAHKAREHFFLTTLTWRKFVESSLTCTCPCYISSKETGTTHWSYWSSKVGPVQFSFVRNFPQELSTGLPQDTSRRNARVAHSSDAASAHAAIVRCTLSAYARRAPCWNEY